MSGPTPVCRCFEVPEFSCIQCQRPVTRRPNGWWQDDQGSLVCAKGGTTELQSGETLHHRGVRNWTEHFGHYDPASQLEPNPDCPVHFPKPPPVTYVCSEPGCEAVFSDPEPDEAWGQYVEHQTGHDMDNDYTLTAEVQN